MLQQLAVHDFALCDENTLEFSSGMICITGETGAGKSLTVDALGLICGQRAEASMVKTGAEKAEIEAVFTFDSGILKSILDEAGIESDDNTIIIRRQIFKDGKSRAYVNSHVQTLSFLKLISPYLVSINGQHAGMRLLDEKFQLNILDEMGNLAPLRKQLNQAFENYNKERSHLSELAKKQQEGALLYKSRLHDLKLLRALKPDPDSYEEVSKKYDELQSLVRSQDAVSLALAALDNNEHNVIDIIASRLNDLKVVSSPDNAPLNEVSSLFTEALRNLDKARILLGTVNTDVSPEVLASCEEKLSTYHNLARKFSVTPGDLYKVSKTLEEQLSEFLSLKDEIEKLTSVVKNLRDEYEKLSVNLSQMRLNAAQKMSQAVTEKIHELSMPQGQFKVELKRDEESRPRRDGRDDVSFLFTANLGEPLQVLGTVASGGELSRLALAIEVLTASKSSVPTLIFDEIDAGISGRTASCVGVLLHELSSKLQVLTVTHLPQVAACADSHFLVVKENTENSVRSKAKLLNHDERVYELGRMMGGSIVTKATLEGALALLNERK